MARRKKTDAVGSLDSLLDTMTNVVGILVILLVVTQMGVREAVSRIAESDHLKPEAVAKVQAEASTAWMLRMQLEQQLARVQNTDPQAIRDQLQIERETSKEKLERMEKSRERAAAVIVQRIEAAEKLKSEQQMELAELERKQRQLEDQIAALRARLEAAPSVDLPPPKVVHLPNPRPAPKGARPISFICRDGRVIPVNIEGAQKQSKAWTDAYIARYRLNRDSEKGIDCDRLFRAFNRESFDDASFRLRMTAISDYAYIVFERKANAGETVEQIKRPTSKFQQSLRRVDATKYYLRFIVWTDSYETYITARNIATELDVLAGWQPTGGESEYRLRLRGNLRCGPPPDPPPVAAKPPTAKPAEPPREPPADTID